MNLIQKKHPAVRFLNQSVMIFRRTRKCPLGIPKKMRHQKLRIMRIIGTIERRELLFFDDSRIHRKPIHRIGKIGFAGTGRTGNQNVQPLRRI